MTPIKKNRIYLIPLIFFLITACDYEVISDQVNFNKKTKDTINPKPIDRNFLRINKNHKILIACIDLGIDYNHPGLINNVHFQLDETYQPVRFGWDYVGNDPFPAPYIGRSDLETHTFDYFFIQELIKIRPDIESFLNPNRNTLKEYINYTMHGMHTAGLLVKGREDFGILGYRYGPVSSKGVSYITGLMENIIKSTNQAIEDGADIINISSSFTADVDVANQSHKTNFISAHASNHISYDDQFPISEYRRFCDSFENIVRLNPEILFLIALGNQNTIIYCNSKTQINFGTGISAKNLLRVGSLDKHGNISSFSNIAANGDNAIYILGENIISFKPTHMLVPPMAWAKNYLCLLNEINQGNESYKSIADFLMFTNKEHVESDGTSPATAKVAHLAAEFMVDEGLEPQETINKLLEMSAVTETNGIKFHKLILNE